MLNCRCRPLNTAGRLGRPRAITSTLHAYKHRCCQEFVFGALLSLPLVSLSFFLFFHVPCFPFMPFRCLSSPKFSHGIWRAISSQRCPGQSNGRRRIFYAVWAHKNLSHSSILSQFIFNENDCHEKNLSTLWPFQEWKHPQQPLNPALQAVEGSTALVIVTCSL